MRKVVKKRKLVMMNASEELYNKIENLRKEFNKKNGTEISLIQAGELFARNVKPPRIPDILGNKNKRKRL